MPLVEIIVPSIPSNVPAFLAKLWKMVENQDTGEANINNNNSKPCMQAIKALYAHTTMGGS